MTINDVTATTFQSRLMFLPRYVIHTAYSSLQNEMKRNKIYGVGRKNTYYPKHSFRQHWRCVWKLMLMENDGFIPISQSSNFPTITILWNGVFSPLFSKYVLFIRNKMCPPIKWSIFLRVWSPLILLTILKLVSQSSNFAKFTILQNGVFSHLFSKYVQTKIASVHSFRQTFFSCRELNYL